MRSSICLLIDSGIFLCFECFPRWSRGGANQSIRQKGDSMKYICTYKSLVYPPCVEHKVDNTHFTHSSNSPLCNKQCRCHEITTNRLYRQHSRPLEEYATYPHQKSTYTCLVTCTCMYETVNRTHMVGVRSSPRDP